MTTIYVTKDTTLPERRAYELYPTERNLIRAAFSHRPGKVATILDAGAGDGQWGMVAREFYPQAIIDGVEIRDLPKPAGFDGWYCCDFLTFQPASLYDLIISNPPYGPEVGGVSTAERFVRHSWNLVAPGGTMIFLLRLAFQAGVDRYKGLWFDLPLWKSLICSRRPSFYDRGTNGTDYSIYIWRKKADGQPLGVSRRWFTELLIYDREAA